MSLNPNLQVVNSLPNDKILALTKRKAFADDEYNMARRIDLELAEDIVWKGENAVYQHFLVFLQYFAKAFSIIVHKTTTIMVLGKYNAT